MIAALSVVTTSNHVDRSKYDAEKIKKFNSITGIYATRQSAESPMYLAIEAVERLRYVYPDALENVKTVIYVTQSQDRDSPCHAASFVSYFELPLDSMAFDVNQSCSGFVYGLTLARRLIDKNGNKRVLLICVDKLRMDTGDVDDLIFSDAASACVVAASHEQLETIYRTDGDGACFLHQVDGVMRMDGSKVFDYMATMVPEVLRQMPGDCDYLVPHQANETLLNLIDRRSGFKDRSLRCIRQYGNMSMVSIPMALAKNEHLIAGKKLLLAGFGAGWSIAATTCRWLPVAVTTIREIEA